MVPPNTVRRVEQYGLLPPQRLVSVFVSVVHTKKAEEKDSKCASAIVTFDQTLCRHRLAK
jgi:hypothetical protein